MNSIKHINANENRLLVEFIDQECINDNDKKELLKYLDDKIIEHNDTLNQTSYMNIILFVLQMISDKIDFNIIKQSKVIKELINEITMWKIGFKIKMKSNEYHIVDVDIGNNFGILATLENENGERTTWEFFD